MAEKYAGLLKTMLLTCFYAPVSPIATVIAIVGLTLVYWSDKYVFLRRMSIPKPMGKELAINMIELLEWAAFFFALGSLSWFNLVSQGSYASIQLPIAGGVALGLAFINLALPMERFNHYLFKIKDEAEENISYWDALSKQMFPTTYGIENPATKTEEAQAIEARLLEYQKASENFQLVASAGINTVTVGATPQTDSPPKDVQSLQLMVLDRKPDQSQNRKMDNLGRSSLLDLKLSKKYSSPASVVLGEPGSTNKKKKISQNLIEYAGVKADPNKFGSLEAQNKLQFAEAVKSYLTPLSILLVLFSKENIIQKIFKNRNPGAIFEGIIKGKAGNFFAQLGFGKEPSIEVNTFEKQVDSCVARLMKNTSRLILFQSVIQAYTSKSDSQQEEALKVEANQLALTNELMKTLLTKLIGLLPEERVPTQEDLYNAKLLGSAMKMLDLNSNDEIFREGVVDKIPEIKSVLLNLMNHIKGLTNHLGIAVSDKEYADIEQAKEDVIANNIAISNFNGANLDKICALAGLGNASKFFDLNLEELLNLQGLNHIVNHHRQTKGEEKMKLNSHPHPKWEAKGNIPGIKTHQTVILDQIDRDPKENLNNHHQQSLEEYSADVEDEQQNKDSFRAYHHQMSLEVHQAALYHLRTLHPEPETNHHTERSRSGNQI